MEFKTWYKNFSYKMLGPSIESILPYFESIKPDMQKANMKISLREYVSISLASTLLFFVFSMIFTSFFLSFVSTFGIVFIALFTFTISVGLSLGVLFYAYINPSMKAKARRRNIDYALPFATLYMSTASGSKAPPETMFKILAEFEEYSEISTEAKTIVRNIELFGMDLVAAIRKTIDNSPSEDFKELLWGIVTTYSSGGDIKNYLHERAKGFMQDYKRKLAEFSEKLSTLIEIYLTLIIVGSIFFVVLTSIMSAFGLGGNTINLVITAQFLIVFLGLPLITAGMIYFIKQISPVSK